MPRVSRQERNLSSTRSFKNLIGRDRSLSQTVYSQNGMCAEFANKTCTIYTRHSLQGKSMLYFSSAREGVCHKLIGLVIPHATVPAATQAPPHGQDASFGPCLSFPLHQRSFNKIHTVSFSHSPYRGCFLKIKLTKFSNTKTIFYPGLSWPLSQQIHFTIPSLQEPPSLQIPAAFYPGIN